MDRKNPLTNDYPALPELKTRINAAGKSRIFNTAENKKALTLQNILCTRLNFTEPLSYQGSAFLKLPKFP